MVRYIRQKLGSLFPIIPEMEREEVERHLLYHNLHRMRLVACALAVFFLALIPVDFLVLEKAEHAVGLSLFPWLLGGRVFLVAGSVAFIMLLGSLPSPDGLRPKHFIAELAYLLAVPCTISFFNGLFLVFRESLSPFFMTVFTVVALVRLDVGKSALVFGSSGIVMLAMVLVRAGDVIRIPEFFTNVIIFSSLAVVTAQVIYAKEVKDFLNQRLIEKQNTDLERVNMRLRRLCTMDDLTEVPNRRFFNQSLVKEWRRAARDHRFLSFIMADLDYFKNLNDTRGHRMGDECLKAVARVLGQTIFREGDMVARYGGEEFAIILPDTDLAGASVVAEKMREAVEELDFTNPGTQAGIITISMGVACALPAESSGIETLIMEADEALYQAKSSGRNRVVVSGKMDGAVEILKRSSHIAA